VRRVLLAAGATAVAVLVAAAGHGDEPSCDPAAPDHGGPACVEQTAGFRSPASVSASSEAESPAAPTFLRPAAEADGAPDAVATTETASDQPAPTASTTTLPPPPPPVSDPSHPAELVTEADVDVPNPFVLLENGVYHLYATEMRGHFYEVMNVPVRLSLDGRTWVLGPDVLPELGAWAVQGATWAPDVRRIDDGRLVLYYTARLAGHRPATQCIGAAVADNPLGPFTPVGTEPLVCQLDRLGSIDPRSFEADDGRLWLHWKSDDNADTEASTRASIYAAPLAADGTEFAGPGVEILHADQPWEGRIVEAPQMIRDDRGRHWLFYSGNWFNQPAYAIGVAACDGPAGPCHKPFDHPWLASNAQGKGPGEASLFRDRDGSWRIVYAPWAQQFETETPRPVARATVGFDDVGPYLAANR
jgi:hypothetical protein